MPDLIKLAKAKYENICTQLDALVIYLTEVGVLERETRKKK
jgi:hypothetical protein